MFVCIQKPESRCGQRSWAKPSDSPLLRQFAAPRPRRMPPRAASPPGKGAKAAAGKDAAPAGPSIEELVRCLRLRPHPPRCSSASSAQLRARGAAADAACRGARAALDRAGAGAEGAGRGSARCGRACGRGCGVGARARGARSQGPRRRAGARDARAGRGRRQNPGAAGAFATQPRSTQLAPSLCPAIRAYAAPPR